MVAGMIVRQHLNILRAAVPNTELRDQFRSDGVDLDHEPLARKLSVGGVRQSAGLRRAPALHAEIVEQHGYSTNDDFMVTDGPVVWITVASPAIATRCRRR